MFEVRASGSVDGLENWARVEVEGLDSGGCLLVVLGSDYGTGHAGVPLTEEEAYSLARQLLRLLDQDDGEYNRG